MNNNLVSIIVPVYKVDLDYLRECILSIKNQTYGNFEAIVIFDGADSKIIEFYKELVKNDKRFKYISRENRGVSYTRNEGISMANSEWLTFVDADDWLENNSIEVFSKYVSKIEDADFVVMKNFKNCGNTQVIIDNKISGDCVLDKNLISKLFQSSYCSKEKVFSYCNSVWKNFYRTSFIKNNKIEFDQNLKVAEDMLFNFDVWNLSKNGYYINYPIYHYRINENSVMNSDIEKLMEKYVPVYPKLYEKINTLGNDYSKDFELFIINQLERYAIGIKKIKYSSYKKKIKNIIKNDYYSNAIENSKLSSRDLKHALFLLFLKIGFIFGTYILVNVRG